MGTSILFGVGEGRLTALGFSISDIKAAKPLLEREASALVSSFLALEDILLASIDEILLELLMGGLDTSGFEVLVDCDCVLPGVLFSESVRSGFTASDFEATFVAGRDFPGKAPVEARAFKALRIVVEAGFA
jgi:hypothetical protein